MAGCVRNVHGLRITASVGFLLAMLAAAIPTVIHAIEIQPTRAEIQAALDRGRAAAEARKPPNHLYAWFGSDQELESRGFVVTKVAALAVMSTHFALRSATPSEKDIERILQDPFLMVTVFLFGSHPQFAIDTYLVLQQGERLVNPAKVRFDGIAQRSDIWPSQPAYRAKAVGFFPYDRLNPKIPTRLSVFPGSGGEVSFELDFSRIK